MKFLPIILALSLLLTACTRHAATFDKQIVGSWTKDLAFGTITYKPDGGFIQTDIAKSGTNIFAGTWQITDGDLITTITNGVLDGVSMAGATMRSKIVSMDAHRFLFESRGITLTLSR